MERGARGSHVPAEGRRADLIVIGLGAMGSATADAAAAVGRSVIGLEAFGRGHSFGSSHGPTRMLRRITEEGPAYVPLVLDALAHWRALNDELDAPVYLENGAIRIAPVGGELHRAFDESAAAFCLDHETLDAVEVEQRFPGFSVPDGFAAKFEREAGILFAGRAVAALQDRAVGHGAALHFDEPVLDWRVDGDGVVVTTASAVYRAARLVISAGAWTNRVVADLGLPLEVRRVVNVSFEPTERADFTPDRLPAFIASDGTNGVYGIPAIDGPISRQGVKVGGGGTPVDPDNVGRIVSAAETLHLRGFIDRFLPRASGPVTSVLTCLYTVTPDGHFIIDRHPEHPQVVVASPCSGHGFKYTTAIGPLLRDLAFDGTTQIPIDAFGIDRFALTAESAS